MRVEAVGYAAVKGTRHLSRPSLHVRADGVAGDRRWCLVDVAARGVLRTVRHPALMALRAETVETVDGTALRLGAPGLGPVEGVPAPTGEEVRCDYWGRPVSLALCAGPHGALASAWLRCEVRLAEAPPGAVVYGGAVSLVGAASAGALAVPAGRFRPNVVVAGVAAFGEDEWLGCDLHLGRVVVRPRVRTPRCAVVERDAHTGARAGAAVLPALARRGAEREQAALGVDGDVVVPGVVRVGDAVRVRRPGAAQDAP